MQHQADFIIQSHEFCYAYTSLHIKIEQKWLKLELYKLFII